MERKLNSVECSRCSTKWHLISVDTKKGGAEQGTVNITRLEGRGDPMGACAARFLSIENCIGTTSEGL